MGDREIILPVRPERDIAALEVGVDVRPHAVGGAGGIGRFQESPARGKHVQRMQGVQLEPAVHEHRDGGIAPHRPGFAAEEFPFGQPAPFAVHGDDAADHVDLPLGIDQRQQLVEVPAGVPEGEHRIADAFIDLADAPLPQFALFLPHRPGRDAEAVLRLGVAELHDRILPVDVADDARVDEAVVERRIEHRPLLRGAAFDPDAAEVGSPLRPGGLTDFVKLEGPLFLFEILAGIVDADEGDAHLEPDLLPRLELVEMEPVADVVAGELAGIGGIDLILACIGVPGGLGRHRALLFPVAGAVGHAADADDEIDREHGLAVVAEGAHELHALDLGGIDAADHGPAFVGQALAEVDQDVALAAGEGVLLEGGPAGGGQLRPDAAREVDAVIARGRRLVFIGAAVDVVIDLQRTRGRHRQDGPEIGTADAGQVDMGEAGEVAVLLLVGRAPPVAVLVPEVELRAHDVEGRDAHHAVRHQGAGVAGAVVRGADEGVDAVHGVLRRQGQCGQQQAGEQEDSSHFIILGSGCLRRHRDRARPGCSRPRSASRSGGRGSRSPCG